MSAAGGGEVTGDPLGGQPDCSIGGPADEERHLIRVHPGPAPVIGRVVANAQEAARDQEHKKKRAYAFANIAYVLYSAWS